MRHVDDHDEQDRHADADVERTPREPIEVIHELVGEPATIASVGEAAKALRTLIALAWWISTTRPMPSRGPASEIAEAAREILETSDDLEALEDIDRVSLMIMMRLVVLAHRRAT